MATESVYTLLMIRKHIAYLSVLLFVCAGCGKSETATAPEAQERPVPTQPRVDLDAKGTAPELGEVRDKADGFVWHPTGSEGRLLVVLPDRYIESVVRCTIEQKTEEDWREVEQGVPHIQLGGELRARFRFVKPGSAYPTPSYIAAHLSDGSIVRWEISAPQSSEGKPSDIIAAEAAAMAMDHPDDPEAADRNRTVSLQDYEIRTPTAGFEWQPGNSPDDRLVIYLPPQLKGLVEQCSVSVLGPNDWVALETGELRVESGAPRDMFVFPHGGSFYPNHCHVVAKLNNDSMIVWEIKGTENVHR